jgi:hypothetical protein
MTSYSDTSPSRGLTPTTLFAGAAVLALVFLAFANFGDGENGGVGPYIVTVVVTLAVAAALVFWQWDRLASRPAYWAVVLGILAVLACIVFWSGLPFAFGPAAVGLAAVAGNETRAKVGGFLGALGVVVAALGCIFG